MARLFELFVAEWLRHRLPASHRLIAQLKVHLDPAHRLSFEIDLVLTDARGERTFAVLDTKYKVTSTPSTDDVAQVAAYAAAKGCTDAVLVYPVGLARSLELRVGRIRVRSLGFELNGDLEKGGERFMRELLRGSPPRRL